MGEHHRAVIVVEDDQDGREILAELLSEVGHQPLAAADGAEALLLLHRCPRPVLVLLDLLMPRLDGREFLEALTRLYAPGEHICVLLVSALPGAELTTSPHVVGHLRKPFDASVLLGLLEVSCRFSPGERKRVSGESW